MSNIHELSLLLPATVESARAARRAIDALPFDKHDEALFNLRLLITELVGNSVRHAGLTPADTIIFELQLSPTLVRAQITDRGPGFIRPIIDKPPSGTSGRGLFLVDALADRWGTESDDTQASVWFEIDL